MIWLALLGVSMAADASADKEHTPLPVSVRSDTVAQIRHDFFGASMVPLNEYLQISGEGEKVSIDGYAGLEWANGLDQSLNPSIYQLNASGKASSVRWSAGRQQSLTAIRPQSYDGASVLWRPSNPFQLEAWGGWARNQDLNDLADGVGLGRIAAQYGMGALRARAGTQLQAEPGRALQLVEDVEARVHFLQAKGHPEARGLLVMGGPDATQVDWARLEAGISLVRGVRTGVHAQMRRAIDPEGLLGEAIVAIFAPDGVREAGGDVRFAGTRWQELAVSYAASSYQVDNQTQYGHAVDVSYRPGGTEKRIQLLPSYRFRSGPGGVFHAAYATTNLRLGDANALALRGAVVPYHKLREDWRTTVSLGLDGQHQFGDAATLKLGTTASSDAVYAFDLRAFTTLTLRYQ